MKFSIITVTHNGIEHTTKCINSIFAHTKDFEFIVVDNGSVDGTTGYLKELMCRHDNVKVIFNAENSTFSKANNQGIKQVEGEYIIFINNDTIVNDGWADKMLEHMHNVPLKHVGMVGPVTNNSNGRQCVGAQDPRAWYEEHKGHWTHTGRLYGWCILAKKAVIDEIGGFDERFTNSYEDNDFCYRAQLAGYKLIIAYDTYIHHTGQGTFRAVGTTEADYMNNGEVNQKLYHDKWRNTDKKKLVVVYRTNGGKWLEESLRQTSKFADSILIHFCRARGNMDQDRLRRLLVTFPKIIKIEFYDGIFQEDYERGWLLQEALKLHATGEADWCISVDDDELYEDKFIERIQRMMSPRNPEIFGYWCQWRTIWDKRGADEYYRTDSTFGRFSNYRFFRLIKNQEITSIHPEGHHCGSNPALAPENLRWTNIRVKHMGYDTHEQRQKKYEFYEANDHFKSKADIGNDDYSHLIDLNVKLEKYRADHGVSLIMMVKDEEKNIKDCLEGIEPLIDEAVIVDTGSSDRTIEIIEEYAAHSPVQVKLLHYPWEGNYSTPRNFGKLHATKSWILMLDADERLEYSDINKLWEITEMDKTDAVIFHCLNYLERRVPGREPRYASTETMRLYRNIPEFYYSGIIHETVDDALCVLRARRKVNVMCSPTVLHHFGYLKGPEKVQHKLTYYEKLNDEQIKVTDGTDPRPYFNLALHFLNTDEHKKALSYFHEALKINPGFWHANQQMAAINIKSAKEFLQRTLQTIPGKHPYKKEAIETLEFLEKHSHGYEKVGV